MNSDKAKTIIINILQKTLIGELKEDSKFNPQWVADAIVKRIQFETTLTEKQTTEIIETIIDKITEAKEENESEFESLNSETEKLLRNFIRGKVTAKKQLNEG